MRKLVYIIYIVMFFLIPKSSVFAQNASNSSGLKESSDLSTKSAEFNLESNSLNSTDAAQITNILNTIIGNPYSSSSSSDILPLNKITPKVRDIEPQLEKKLTNNSARIKRPISVANLKKRSYKSTEPVKILIDDVDSDTSKLNVEVTNINTNEILNLALEETIGVEGRVITLYPTIKMKPGKYKVKVTDDSRIISEQDFTWGVLAINTNKSIYNEGDKVLFSIAVLDDTGSMVCDAKLNLEIYNPNGNLITLSTDNGKIISNPECKLKEYTQVPDFQAEYEASISGKYGITLTSTSTNGTVSIRDYFTVDNKMPFDVVRITQTRIYPPVYYPVNLKLKAKQDFIGQIIETVPQEFEIEHLEGVKNFEKVEIVAGSNNLDQSENKISIRMPFEGEYNLTQGFGDELKDPELIKKYTEFGLSAHDGTDFDLPSGTPVLAVDDGIVDHADWEPYGQTVIIQHRWGRSYYGHLSEFTVLKGASIKKGEQLGLSGSTGLSTGPHLHFGIRLNSYDIENGFYGKVNPMPYLTSDSIMISDVAVKHITWRVDLKKDEEITLGYKYKAPQVSPEFYLLGPLKIYEKNSIHLLDSESDNPFVLGDTIESSTSAYKKPLNNGKILVERGEIATGSGKVLIKEIATENLDSNSDSTNSSIILNNSTMSGQILGSSKESTSSANLISNDDNFDKLIFAESRQWQIAADAIIEMGDGLLVYDEADTSPVYRAYTNSTNSFSSETNLTATVNPSKVVMKTSPTKYEAVAVVMVSTTSVYAYCFDGTSWTNDWNNTVNTPVDIDVAYEWHTGDVLVAWVDSGANKRIRYRTKPGHLGCGGSNWDAEATYDHPNLTSSVANFVKLVSDERSSSDVIALGISDTSTDDLDFALWDGSSFGNAPGALTIGNMSATYAHAFAMGFERISGNLVTVFGIEAGRYRYRRCTGGGATCTWQATQNLGTTTQSVRNAYIASEPGSDNMTIATLDATNDLEVFLWDGATMTRTAPDSSCEPVGTEAAPTQQIAAAYLTFDGATRSVVVYQDLNATNLGWVVCNTTTCTVQADQAITNSFTDPQIWYEMEQDPKHLDRALFLGNDNSNNLKSKRIQMTASTPTFSWTESDGGADLEGSLSAISRKHFAYDYWRWAPIANPEAVMRHGKWWNGHSRQVFAF